MRSRSRMRIYVCFVVLATVCSERWSSSQASGVQLMQANCDEISKTVTARVEIAASRPRRVNIRVRNASSMPLWVPAQSEPAYEFDAQGHRVTIWMGYFDQIHKDYRDRYVIPSMTAVQPGHELVNEITSPDLVEMIVEKGFAADLNIRVATRELRVSRVRGEQPLDDYIAHSCEISSNSTQDHP